MARKKFNPIPMLTAGVGGLGGKMLLDVLYGVPQLNTKPEFPAAALLVLATGADHFLGGTAKTAYFNDAAKGVAGVAGAELASSLLNGLNGYRVHNGYRVAPGGRVANMARR